MPANNLRQALVPEGATAIADPQPGTAPGLRCPLGDQVIYAVPGVPFEMMEIMTGAILPDLARRSGQAAVIRSRTLRTWGMSESGLAERLAPRLDELDALAAAGSGGAPAPTLAFLASGIEGLKVRVTVKAPTDAEATAVLDAEEQVAARHPRRHRVRPRRRVDGARGRRRSWSPRASTLAVAESLTGGLVAARLVNVAGASTWFRGGVVTYATDAQAHAARRARGARGVARRRPPPWRTGVREVMGADVGLGVTGVAGPDPQEGQRPGTVFLAVAGEGEPVTTRCGCPGDRERVRQFACISLLDLLRRSLTATAPLERIL